MLKAISFCPPRYNSGVLFFWMSFFSLVLSLSVLKIFFFIKVGIARIGLKVIENIFLMWLFAKPVFTNFNQSWDGFFFGLVMISTTSPFFNWCDRGIILPSIFALSQWLPISE